MRFTEALRSLRQAQKSSRGISLYSRWLNRPLGRVFAAMAASTGIGPNGVTALSAVVTAAGLVLLIVAPASAATGVGVAVLLVLGFALDSADGQVARLTGTNSPAGEWLDHVVDAGKMVAVHGAVLIALWRDGVDPAWCAVALAYQFVSVVFFAALTLFPLLRRGGRDTTAQPSTVRAMMLLPADYGVLALAFVLWGIQPVFLLVYAALFIATALIAAALCVKWFRGLSVAAA
ncbi:CDP-alcohol phosphatidyltransferase family protein [Microbacterium sp. NPDC055521]